MMFARALRVVVSGTSGPVQVTGKPLTEAKLSLPKGSSTHFRAGSVALHLATFDLQKVEQVRRALTACSLDLRSSATPYSFTA